MRLRGTPVEVSFVHPVPGRIMPLRSAWLLPLVLLSARPLAAQLLPVSIAVDARAGMVVPTGDFASSADGFESESGLGFAIGGSIHPSRMLGVFAAYQRTEFGCDQCAVLGLEDSAVVKGLEAGIHVGFPLSGSPVTPWVRGGVIHQTLGFDAGEDAMSSDPEIGFTGAVGVTVPLMNHVELNPAARYFTVPADFEFSDLPARSIDVAAFSVDLGVSLRF